MKFAAMAVLGGMALSASAPPGGMAVGGAVGATAVGVRHPAPVPNAASLGLGMLVLAARRARR